MADSGELRRDSARRKAQDQFTKMSQRDEAFRQERDRARAVDVAKMNRLRNLRLAKEAAERQARETAEREKPSSPTPAPRKRKRKTVKRAPGL